MAVASRFAYQIIVNRLDALSQALKEHRHGQAFDLRLAIDDLENDKQVANNTRFLNWRECANEELRKVSKSAHEELDIILHRLHRRASNNGSLSHRQRARSRGSTPSTDWTRALDERIRRLRDLLTNALDLYDADTARTIRLRGTRVLEERKPISVRNRQSRWDTAILNSLALHAGGCQ